MSMPANTAPCVDQVVDILDIKTGDKLWWNYASCKAFKPKQIAAVVLWTGKSRVRIEFVQWLRYEWVREIRTIAVSNLLPRVETSHGIDQFHSFSQTPLAA